MNFYIRQSLFDTCPDSLDRGSIFKSSLLIPYPALYLLPFSFLLFPCSSWLLYSSRFLWPQRPQRRADLFGMSSFRSIVGKLALFFQIRLIATKALRHEGTELHSYIRHSLFDNRYSNPRSLFRLFPLYFFPVPPVPTTQPSKLSTHT